MSDDKLNEQDLPLEPAVLDVPAEILPALVPTDTTPVPKPELPPDDEEVKQSKEFKDLQARIKSKSKTAELHTDMKTVTYRKGMNFSNKGKRTADDYRPTPDELEIINTISATDQKREDGYSFPLESADDKVDRQDEFFFDGARDKAAAISYNKAFLTDHAWDTAHHLGTIYMAVNEAGILKQKVWVLDIPENQKYIKNMLGGVYNKVSVGFASNLQDMVCMSCAGEKSIYDNSCPHVPGGVDEKGIRTVVGIKDIADFYEVSLVPIPAQRDAGIRRMSVDAQQDFVSSIKGIIEVLSDTTDGAISKKVDTISSGNSTLGDVQVPDTTTLNSTAEASSEKTADVITAEVTAVEAPAAAPEAPVVESEKTDTEPAAAPAVEEATQDVVLEAPAPEAPQAPVEKAATEELVSVIGDLKAAVQELKEAVGTLKGVTAPQVSALGESQKGLEAKLEALSKFVEAATATTFETLEREVVAKKQINSTTTSGAVGNQWAVDLTKGILGGK